MGHYVLPRANRPGGGGASQGGSFAGGTPGQIVVTDTGPTIAGASWFTWSDADVNRFLVEINRTAAKSVVFRVRNSGFSGVVSEALTAGGDYGFRAYRAGFGGVWLGGDASASGEPSTLSVADGGNEPTAGLNDLMKFFPASKTSQFSSGWGLATTTVNNAIHTVLITQPCVRFTNLSATRVCTLPAANTLQPGGIHVVTVDSTGAAGVYVDITRAGADTIEAGTTYRLDSAYEVAFLMSDGVSAWQILNK